jgi:hypothetical protein
VKQLVVKKCELHVCPSEPIYPIFHGPGHMLTAQKSLRQKNSEKIVFLEKCFLYIFFASGLSPYNDAFLIYSAKSTKNQKMQVI